jgi:hypothetical protein
VRLDARTKMLNPKWYEGMLGSGYEGVREIQKRLTNTMGWSATAGAVDNWVYDEANATFIEDEEMQKRLLETNPNRYESTPSSLVPHPLRAAGELSAIPDRPQAPVPDPSSHGSQRPLWRRAEAHIVDFPLGTGSTPNSSGSDRVCRGVILTASARWWRRSWRRTVAATGTPRIEEKLERLRELYMEVEDKIEGESHRLPPLLCSAPPP